MFANERGAREGLTTTTGATPATCVARLQGRLALASGDAEAAVVHLRRAAAGGRPSDIIDLARATWRHQGASAAREVAQRALALAPTAPRALYPLVELLASLGAQRELPRAVSLAVDPGVRAALLARGLRLSGDPAGAQTALAAAGDAPLVQLERALLALEQQDAAGAVAAADAARAAPPAMAVEVLSVRIRALVAAGRDSQADAVLKTELTQRMNRGNRQAVFRLRLLRAAIALDRGDPASLRLAAADIDFARVTLTIGSADPIVLAAALAAKQGLRTDAVRLYHQALAHDPTRRDAFSALDALGEAGDLDRALFTRSWPEAAAAMQSR
jgi:tetratricopeptide (TPR) repeat protein